MVSSEKLICKLEEVKCELIRVNIQTMEFIVKVNSQPTQKSGHVDRKLYMEAPFKSCIQFHIKDEVDDWSGGIGKSEVRLRNAL